MPLDKLMCLLLKGEKINSGTTLEIGSSWGCSIELFDDPPLNNDSKGGDKIKVLMIFSDTFFWLLD